jgi:tetratricopeptide (TPR) repeat protein
MRSSAAWWQRSCAALVLAGIVVLGFSVSPVAAQAQGHPGVPSVPDDQRDIPRRTIDTLEKVTLRNGPNAGEQEQKTTRTDDTCLLPPLTLISSPTIAAEQLQITAKARKEYHEACAALKKKVADVEKHLRKAVQHYPKYSVAWVTLGQVLAAQQRTDEARSACFQGSIANPGYVPAYLCLADIAARAHAWDKVLKLSDRALELDPANNAVAYEYHAAANLNLHNLAAAEKSGLRAVEIDRDHREPRVHFVLAQIYEAKGDSANEGVQLREYLRYANSPDDVAVVEQYLSKLEKQTGKGQAADYPSGGSSPEVVRLSTRRWGPADIDEVVPPVGTTICPLPQILKETSKRTQDLIENLQRFSANERIEQIDIGKNGKSRNATTQVVNYVAEVEENSSGYPTVKEYRSGSTGIRTASVMDTGTAAFALIFHPTHVGNFAFRCEGLTELRASPAWQMHFEESADPTKPFQAIRIGGSVYLPRLKGRAWIGTDTYDVMRLETDLVSPIPQIDLQLEHQVISYAPVEFQEHHTRLWLPESTSLHITYHGRRYERVHTFSQFLLFSVDAAPVIKGPITEFIANK